MRSEKKSIPIDARFGFNNEHSVAFERPMLISMTFMMKF